MTVADAIARSVDAWLETLDPAQRERATFPFDTEERFVWAFTPGERKGLALRDMEPRQREAAMGLVRSSMSERGAREVADVIELETVLGALEREGGRANGPRRDPELYWFAVFGGPSEAAPWSWRVGGHHVAIHMTVAGGRSVGSTPSFLGANPAVVPSGPTAGRRTLLGEEGLARELLSSLSPAQRDVAVVDPVAPPEILTGNSARADARSVPRGIRYDDLHGAARQGLERLIRHYLGRATDSIAEADWRSAVVDGLPETSFAWAGPIEPGLGHYYAVHGPRLLIEYDNTQNGANHIHAVWRDLANDWGEDLLAAHYRTGHGALIDRSG